MGIKSLLGEIIVNYIFPPEPSNESWFPDIYDDAKERAESCFESTNGSRPKTLAKIYTESKERD